ncbi:bifunctional metallophosphatase/5'-nucleotidase [Lacticaseibacillus sp. GG6-2]
MQLTILSTSDTHGYVLPTNYATRAQHQPYGLSRAATVVGQLQAASEAALVLDNGDWLQGSPLAYYAARVAKDPQVLTAAYAPIGYDAGVLGNHEFNYGLPYLRQALAQLNYPTLCANILHAGQPAFGRAYQIFVKNGVRIAVLGLTTTFIPHWELPANIAGLQFVDAVACAKEWVPRLQAQADVVVVAYHGGFERALETGRPTEKLTGENEGYALTQIPGVDALITGHQHRELAGVVNGVPVTQPGQRGSNVGVITLQLQQQANGWQVAGGTARLAPTGSANSAPAIVSTLATTQQQVESWLDSPLGHVVGDMRITDAFAARVQETPYVEFVNRVQMAAVGTDIAATALFSNEGQGFGATITMRDVVTNYVYPNTVVRMQVSGADLRAALEQSAKYFSLDQDGKLIVTPRFIRPKPQHYNYDMYQGLDYTLDITQPVGARVTKLTYHGQPVQSAATYQIALNQYRASGGGNYRMFDPSKIVFENQTDMTELIAEWLRKHPELKATVDHNYHVLPKM